MVDTQTLAQNVYAIVNAIPSGKVLTYGQVARLAGWPNHARLVGHILHHVSNSQVPCHRVVNCQGRPVPHWPKQVSLLHAEGITFKPNGYIDLSTYGWHVFDTE